MADHIWTADDVADHFEEAFRSIEGNPQKDEAGIIVLTTGFGSAYPADRAMGA